MLRMAFEREVIMNIRARVDAYDEQCLFENKRSGLGADVSISHSHVRLGSLDNIVHLGSYAKKLGKDIRLQDLQGLLTTFLRLNRVFSAGDSMVPGLEVGLSYIRQQSAHAHIGGPLSCVTGHIRLPRDSNEEDGPTSCNDFLAWIWGEIRFRHSARLWTVGAGLLPGVRLIHDIGGTRMVPFGGRENL